MRFGTAPQPRREPAHDPRLAPAGEQAAQSFQVEYPAGRTRLSTGKELERSGADGPRESPDAYGIPARGGRPRRRWRGPDPEVSQELLDEVGPIDERENPHSSTAPAAHQRMDLVRPLDEERPGALRHGAGDLTEVRRAE